MPDYHFSNPTDLKLIILFIAENFKRPVSISDVTDVTASGEYASYFPMATAFADLESNSLICPSSKYGKYIVTRKGKEAYDLFSTEIPYTVKKDLLSAINKVRKKETDAVSVIAEYKENRAAGYDLFCEITETGIPIFSMSLTLPSQESAKTAAKNFKKKAQKIYSDIIDNLT